MLEACLLSRKNVTLRYMYFKYLSQLGQSQYYGLGKTGKAEKETNF